MRTRGESGNIEIELKFRDYKLLRNVTYLLVIGEENGKAQTSEVREFIFNKLLNLRSG